MSAASVPLSDEFAQLATAECDRLRSRLEEALERWRKLSEQAEEAAREAARLEQAVRDLGELLGVEDQLSISTLTDELRGQKLREVAARTLWRHFAEGDVVHYKQWFKLVQDEGHRIGGKSPFATFLTQVARIETVERVGQRSGLYRLRARPVTPARRRKRNAA